MPGNSERKGRKTAPVVCAVVVIAFLGVLLGAILLPLLGVGSGDGAAAVILLLYALVILAVIVGVVVALRQRLREIDGGEEDEARKY